jgi:hypothetical protein
MIKAREETGFYNLCTTMEIFLKSQLKNTSKIQRYSMVKCRCWVNEVPKLRIKDPISFVVKNKTNFQKPITLNYRSMSNNPKEFDDEDFQIKEWWNKGYNNEDINRLLAKKREKYFSWQFRYEMITTKFNEESIQWKIS